MSKRYWIAAVIFGLATLAANPQYNWAQERGSAGSEEIYVPLPDYGMFDHTDESDNLTKPCEEGRDKRNSDLCAQWKAADAAKKSADWGVYLGLVGVFIGVLTLAAAFAAAIFAKSAANATWKTVDVTREIGEAQTRAYLNCTSANYKRAKDSVAADIKIENIGNSPATEVTIVGDVTIFDVTGFSTHPRVTRFVASRKNISPCQPIVTKGSVLETINFNWDFDFVATIDELDDIAFKRDAFETGNAIWFDLTIKYRDVFGKMNSIPISLEAIIDAHPLYPKKKRSRTGKLDMRVADGRTSDGRAYQQESD
jgi:hypothetical protein